jgi:hypothetical protein
MGVRVSEHELPDPPEPTAPPDDPAEEFGGADVRQLILDEETLLLVKELGDLRARKKVLTDEEVTKRARILQILKEHQVTEGLTASGTRVVSLSIQNRTKINTNKLRVLFPEAYAKCVEVSVTETLRTL